MAVTAWSLRAAGAALLFRRLLQCALCSVGIGVCSAQPATTPAEFPTAWEVPPGDPVELEGAGLAKVLCSAVFITGRQLAAAMEEDGFFVAPLAGRRAVKSVAIDSQEHAVRVTLPNGVTRSAKLYGEQGCVTLPRGARSVFFTPVRVESRAASAALLWPLGDRLPTTPPPEEVDMAKVEAAAAAAFAPAEALTAAFVVAYKGRIIAERYQSGLDYATRLPGWSMGKSITATLLGQLVQEGVYDLWAPAPVDEWQKPGDPRRAIRIADLLHMSSGLRFLAPQDPDFDPARGYPDHLYVYTGAIDAYRWAITRPAQWPPNTVARYRNSDPLVINYLIKKAVIARGQEYLSYPQSHLFDQLGIRNMVLEPDPHGNFLLQGYELGGARDWLRLGLLYLQDGVWNGVRVLPQGWADFVRTPAPAWPQPVYGAFFWLNRTQKWPVPQDAYFMAGSGSQYTIIIPTHDVVVVRLGHYKGAEQGERALRRALELLIQAVPQVRQPWQPASEQKR